MKHRFNVHLRIKFVCWILCLQVVLVQAQNNPKDTLKEATESIYFEKGLQQWRASSEKRLNQIAELLNQNTSYTLKLGGHTDSKGTVEANMRLSILRAEAVKNHLVYLGVAHFRIKAVGYGEYRPITTNETTSGKALNRRVSCRINKK